MRLVEKNEERAFIIECLKIYKSLPALWDAKSPEYRKKDKKNEAYEILVRKFREKYANINRKDVTKKINTLRTNFRKEVKRLSQERRDVSKLWYFDEMKFLIDHIETKEEVSYYLHKTKQIGHLYMYILIEFSNHVREWRTVKYRNH